MSKSRILITGAAGRIGQLLVDDLSERYDLVLIDIKPSAQIGLYPVHAIDIAQLDALRPLFNGIDTVVHLAADANYNAPWESLLPNNIVGTQNIFQVACEAGCRRVVFASTIHTVHGHPRDVQIHSGMPVRPTSLYGASKAWGEILAAYYAYQHNISCVCVRIGWLHDLDSPQLTPRSPALDLIITPRDLKHLMACAVDAPDHVRFGIFHGVSNNLKKRLDIEETRQVLGYHPQDDTYALARRNYRGMLRRVVGKLRRTLAGG